MGKILALLLLSASAHAAEVIKVHTGDTLTLIDEGKSLRIHLANVDAPDLDQPYGIASRKSLEELCRGKQASFEHQRKSPTGEIHGVVICQGIDTSREQLRRGMAWVIPYPEADVSFTAIQDFIWREEIGLWSEPNPIPPWEWAERKK
jgi:micrococcal nuclease